MLGGGPGHRGRRRSIHTRQWQRQWRGGSIRWVREPRSHYVASGLVTPRDMLIIALWGGDLKLSDRRGNQ